jgi:serine O-acetyltransferase
MERFQQRLKEHRDGQPPLGRALRRDAQAFTANRGEAFAFRSSAAEWRNVVRLLFVTADFTAFALYRLRMTLRRAGVPIVPSMINKICIAFFGLRIGEHVLIEPGVYIPHGTVVIDGATSIGRGSVITPWVTIGVKAGNLFGPALEPGVWVGSHASILGDITVGRSAQIGASAVVTRDVPANAIVAGVPARILASDVPGPLEIAAGMREAKK